MSRKTLQTVAALVAKARAADDAINAAERAPEGDDYNALYVLVRQIAEALPAVVTMTPMQMEVGAPRNGKPGFKWAQGYRVNNEYPPLLRRAALERAREIGGADVIIIIEE
jgi:hypothetical protein